MLLRPIDQSIRLRPRHMYEQERVSLSNAILHNSARRVQHTHTHVRLYIVRLFGGGAMSCDWSIRNGAELNGPVYKWKDQDTSVNRIIQAAIQFNSIQLNSIQYNSTTYISTQNYDVKNQNIYLTVSYCKCAQFICCCAVAPCKPL